LGVLVERNVGFCVGREVGVVAVTVDRMVGRKVGFRFGKRVELVGGPSESQDGLADGTIVALGNAEGKDVQVGVKELRFGDTVSLLRTRGDGVGDMATTLGLSGATEGLGSFPLLVLFEEGFRCTGVVEGL